MKLLVTFKIRGRRTEALAEELIHSGSAPEKVSSEFQEMDWEIEVLLQGKARIWSKCPLPNPFSHTNQCALYSIYSFPAQGNRKFMNVNIGTFRAL